jgi:hypothetical protein
VALSSWTLRAEGLRQDQQEAACRVGMSRTGIGCSSASTRSVTCGRSLSRSPIRRPTRLWRRLTTAGTAHNRMFSGSMTASYGEQNRALVLWSARSRLPLRLPVESRAVGQRARCTCDDQHGVDLP